MMAPPPQHRHPSYDDAEPVGRRPAVPLSAAAAVLFFQLVTSRYAPRVGGHHIESADRPHSALPDGTPILTASELIAFGRIHGVWSGPHDIFCTPFHLRFYKFR